MNSLTIDDLIPILETTVKDRNPLMVKISLEYYQTAIKQTYIDDLKKIYSSICPIFVKLANHQDNSLRTPSLQTLGLLKGRLGGDMEKYISDLNQQKLEKVNESAAEVQLTKYDKPRVAKKKKAPKKPKEEDKYDADGDAVMTFDDPPPKPKKKKKKAGGPPAAFLKRQQQMQAKAADKFEELKAELNGEVPPPKRAAKQESMEEEKIDTASPPATDNKPIEKKANVIVEDTGSGLAKEDASPIIEERVPSTILKKFEEAKWQDKKEAYTQLGRWFLDQEYSGENLEAVLWYIRIKTNDYKEKNVNIAKAALGCISDIINGTSGLTKKSATIIIPFFSERIGDVKYKEVCKEVLLSLSEIVGPSPVVKGMTKHFSDAKAPNVIVEN